MLDDYVISGLTKRRAAISGQIVHLEKQLKQKLLDLKTIDAAIKLFDPNYPIERIRPTGLYTLKDWATRGEMTRLIFNILRQSSEPLTARDIAIQIMAYKEMDTSRPKALVSVRRSVGDALRKQRVNGHVLCKKEPGQPLTWNLITPSLAANTPSIAC